MEKKHREILVRQRANLVENMNMRDGLFTQLITRKVLNQRMVRSIQNGRTLDQQAEELLNVLETRGRNAFKHFCDALRDDFQEEIVELYLEPESSGADTKVDDKDSIQESASAVGSEESQDSVGSTQESEDVKASKSRVEIQAPGLGGEITEVSKVVAPVGISVCEEFQQQIYRRSFEPSLVPTSSDNVDSCRAENNKKFDPYIQSQSEQVFQQNELDQQARIFYENSILHPERAAFSVTNGQRLIMPNSPYKLEKDSAMKPNSPFNPNLGRDSPTKTISSLPNQNSPIATDTVVSQKIPTFHLSSVPPPLPPSFNLSAFQGNIEQLKCSPQKFQSVSSPHVFNRDFNGAKPSEIFTDWQSMLDKDGEAGHTEVHLPVYELGQKNKTLLRPDVQRDGKLETCMADLNKNALSGVYLKEQENAMYKQFNPSTSSVQDFRPTHKVHERDFTEIQGYRERQTSNSNDREVFVFPRHVERKNSERPGEEFHNEGENSVPRLARLDSVDTMNKRPFAEHQEINTKRLCQDRNPVQEFSQPEKLTTVQVYDKVDNQVIKIPVVDVPKLQPAPPVVIIETGENHISRQKIPTNDVMDDPEIDLTDGPVNVRVEVSSKQFYLANHKQAYPMRRIPRGKALILNVNEVVGKSPRRGTDIDRDNLHNLLCQLHFDVTVFNDNDGLTAKEMCLKLQLFSQHPGHKEAECLVVCILSHGEEGYIFGSDGKKFELDAVFELFDNTSCRTLLGKPKIFIIQACRGGALDKGITYSLDEHDGSDAKIRQVPSMSDMLICYPTQMGYYAWRNRDRGSWYVEALVQVFMKYAKNEDICTMLNRVNLLVSKKVSHCPQVEMDQMSQMSEYKSTLRMPHLYFFPGIAGDLYR